MYYTIGEFSNIVRVSTKTLRYYEKIGLFTPKHIDETTKYRYYTENQIADILLIMELKKYEFSLKEVEKLLDKDDLLILENALINKLEETEKQIKKYNYIKEEIQSKIDSLRSMKKIVELYDNYDFKLIEKKDMLVFYKRKVIDINELDKLIEDCFQEIKKMNLQYKEPLMAVYYYDNDVSDYKNIDTEICIEINRTKDTKDINRFKVLKGGLYASVIHIGYLSDSNYDDNVDEVYSLLIQWIQENNYKITGVPFEIMWKKPKITNTQEESVLEICIPICNSIK